jgi:hypothetical protein
MIARQASRGFWLALAVALAAPGQSPGNPLLARYDLRVRLEPAERRLEVEATIELPAAGEARASLAFVLRDDMSPPEVEVLAPPACAGAVAIEDVGAGTEPDGTRTYVLRPPQAFPAGEPIVLRARYAGGGRVSLTFNLDPAGCFAYGGTAWYPWFGDLRGALTARFTAPQGWRVEAGGRLVGEDLAGDHRHFEFAAAGPARLGFAAAPWQVVRRIDGRVPMELYLLRERPFIDEMIAKSVAALPVLEREFGPYPFGEFAIVEVPAGPGQQSGFLGMACEGFYLVREDYLDARGFQVSHFGHEMGHQWFPLLVGSRGDRGAYMLDEALAQYGALRCASEIEGPAAAERLRREWRTGALRRFAAGDDFPLGALPISGGAYELSDTKGVLVYDLLSRTLGPEAFRRALQAVTREYAFGEVEWGEFLHAFETTGETDLGWFWAQWFERPSAPALSLAWEQAGERLTLTLSQPEPAWRLQAPLRIEFEDGSATACSVDVREARTTLALSVDGLVTSVVLDPRAELLLLDEAQLEAYTAQRDFLRGDQLWNQNEVEQALATFRAGLERLPLPDPHGVEFLLRMRLGWMHLEAGEPAAARAECERALSLPVRDEKELAQTYWVLSQACRALGDVECAHWAARGVMAAEAARGAETSLTRKARELLADG